MWIILQVLTDSFRNPFELKHNSIINGMYITPKRYQQPHREQYMNGYPERYPPLINERPTYSIMLPRKFAINLRRQILEVSPNRYGNNEQFFKYMPYKRMPRIRLPMKVGEVTNKVIAKKIEKRSNKLPKIYSILLIPNTDINSPYTRSLIKKMFITKYP